MNTYILYCQETKESIGKLKACCRDVYEVMGRKSVRLRFYQNLRPLMENRSTFSIIDPNGAVISCDLAIKNCILNGDGRLTIHTFELKVWI